LSGDLYRRVYADSILPTFASSQTSRARTSDAGSLSAASSINGQGAYGHIPGGNSELFIFADMDLTVIVLANDDPPSASRIATPICELLTGTK